MLLEYVPSTARIPEWSPMKLLTSVLFAAALFAFASPACQGKAGVTVTIPIEGMDCESCATKIAAALRKLDGVAMALVSYEKKQAVVDFDPKKVAADRLSQKIRETGFTPGTPAPGKESRK
jgi:mercuric ion binding protein